MDFPSGMYEPANAARGEEAASLNDDAFSTGYDTIVVTDVTDADGIVSALLYSLEYDSVGLAFAGYNAPVFPDVDDAVFRAIEAKPETLFISDLGPQEWAFECLSNEVDIRIRDHHRADKDVVRALRDAANVDYVQFDDDEKCAAEIVLSEDISRGTLQPCHEKLVSRTSVVDLNKTSHERYDEAQFLEFIVKNIGIRRFLDLAEHFGSLVTARELPRGRAPRLLPTD